MLEEPAGPAPSDDDDDEWFPGPDPLESMAMGVAQFVASRELMHDARTIMRLGPGTYEIDLLKNSLRHSLRYFPAPTIAANLRARISGALQEMEKSWESLTQATVTFQARLDERDPAQGYRPMNVFGRYAGIYILCRMEINVMLATGEAQYPAFHRGQVDWPRDWHQLGL